MNWKLALFIGLLSFGAYQHFAKQPITHGNGILAGNLPIQTSLPQPLNDANFSLNGYQLKLLQKFDLQARVLSTEHYSSDREADLSPVDLALGWGSMSDEANLKDIAISQSGRWYFWHVDHFPIPREQIEQNSANMHMIPADKTIEKVLKNIKTGQIVQLSGYLVEAFANDGWHWKSSLTRNDIGAGACEVVYVKSISVS